MSVILLSADFFITSRRQMGRNCFLGTPDPTLRAPHGKTKCSVVYIKVSLDHRGHGMRHVTVRQLQVFVEAAEKLSFARVAERLHLTPAGVSFQIKQIETQSGFALFERVGRRVTLTDAGKALLVYARQV